MARRRVGFAALVLVCAVAASVGCGGGDDAGGSGSADASTGDGGADGATVTGVTLPSTCKTDGDCKGGRCVDVGLGAKACVGTKSCTGGAGANHTCGGVPGDESKAGSNDCCDVRAVPGGSYAEFNDPRFPATVSPFLLDTYEVTVGRFRAWVEATDGNLRASAPADGAGAHPKIPGSGWRSEWNQFLPTSRSDVDAMLGPAKCQVGGNVDDYGTLTWWTPSLDQRIKQTHKNDPDILAENTKDALDGKALNCVPWEVLFAFCVWDGGRLPTNAEWGFAAAAGSEQRQFPWGGFQPNDLVHVDGRDDLSLVPLFSAGAKYTAAALYDPALGANVLPNGYAFTWGAHLRVQDDNAAHVAPVGRKALGNGKWGHADLAGGMHEWLLDEGPIKPGKCVDCANVDWPKPDQFDPNAAETIPDFQHKWFQGGARAVRGGAWDNSFLLAIGQSDSEITGYTSYPVRRTYRSLGGRCARDF